jgi:hypothetical protein
MIRYLVPVERCPGNSFMGIEDGLASDVLDGASGDGFRWSMCLVSVRDLKHSELQ